MGHDSRISHKPNLNLDFYSIKDLMSGDWM